jgi:selenocysteine-specific elongation factor
MKYVIVGTAGHIDHGKSALVQALTGTDPDRLEEEKRRGITSTWVRSSDLGDGLRIGFIDARPASALEEHAGRRRGHRLGAAGCGR